MLNADAGGVYEQAGLALGRKMCLFETLDANQRFEHAGGLLYGELEFRGQFGNATNVHNSFGSVDEVEFISSPEGCGLWRRRTMRGEQRAWVGLRLR